MTTLAKPIESQDDKWLMQRKMETEQTQQTDAKLKQKATKKEKEMLIDRLYGKVYKEQQVMSPRRQKSTEEVLRGGWRSFGPESTVNEHRLLSPRNKTVSKKKLGISDRLHNNKTKARNREWIMDEQEKHQHLLYPGHPDCKQVRFDTLQILTGGQPQPGAAAILQTTSIHESKERKKSRSRSRSVRSSRSVQSGCEMKSLDFSALNREEDDDDGSMSVSIQLHEEISTARSSTKVRPPDVPSDYETASEDVGPEEKSSSRGSRRSSCSSTDTEDELSPRYKSYFSSMTSQTSHSADHTTEYDKTETETETSSEAPTAATSEVSKQFFECSATLLTTEHIDMNTTQASLSYMEDSGYD
eukprot:TRINITY_DN2760_c0_g4_i1.p1 TRINITY_DN2760_c0_g4~~TRINITY_DN2760_c0_g4_i1.p1  ORF type:complete len:373 (+),score=83.31 TRINITY_DN2760_c0_g4_i1:46-1119(+)